METNMDKKLLFKRFETAHKMNLLTPEIFKHLENVMDAMSRLEGGQLEYFVDFLEAENVRTHRFDRGMQLANDKLGYDCIRLLAILTHHCQSCAEDIEAWHTRGGFCKHRENAN